MQNAYGVANLLSLSQSDRSAGKEVNPDSNSATLDVATLMGDRKTYKSPRINSHEQKAWWWVTGIFCLLAFTALLVGCGTGGYAGAGITSVSKASITIDAGQSIPVSATVNGSTVNWSLAGCSVSACGSLSAATGASVNYIAPATLTAPITLALQANIAGTKSSKAITVTVNPAPSITGTPLPGIVGQPWSMTLGTTGGTLPVKINFAAIAAPDGFSIDTATGLISGTPKTVGTWTFPVQITDGSDVPYTVTVNKTVVVSNGLQTQVAVQGSPAAGTVGASYTASLFGTGGAAPYTFGLAFGSLPAGLTLSSTGLISGTPTVAGTYLFVVQGQDVNGLQGSGTFTIAIAPKPVSLTTGVLNNGEVGTSYSSLLSVDGGAAPYTCTIVSGALPAGLSFGPGCVVLGIPTVAGAVSLTVKITDSSNPQLNYTGAVSIMIHPAVPTLSLSSPPAATAGTPYNGLVGVSGGTAPYACSLTAGTLPSGLTLNGNCSITGTPAISGIAVLTVHATDASSPIASITGNVTLTVNAAPVTLTLSAPPPATAGSPYTGSIAVSGGTAPYTCSLVSGTLPTGLTLASTCAISGTPTTQGSANITVTATDNNSPAASTTGPVTITVNAASPTLTLSAPPAGTTGVTYAGSIGVSGGTGPYNCTLTGGTLPSGLSLASNCSLSGTPATSGAATVTVHATDSTTPTASTVDGSVTITINPATLTLTSPSNSATVATPYTGTIVVNGGIAPYSCSLASGTIPAGLSLNPGCTITGTPTASGTTAIGVTADDSESPAGTVTGSITITVNSLPALTLTGSVPNATVGVAYTQTLHATGGVAPYTYALTAGSLPAGLSLSSAGEISGTPTAAGASSFTVTVTDSQGTPQTANLPLLLLVVYPTTPNDALLSGPYAFLFQGYDDVLAGLLSYQTASVGSFTADGTGVVSSGELDANHQILNPSGATIDSNVFVGTYTVGSDNRGSLTITTLNADGTTAQTSTYAIAVKAAVSPATASTGGSLIEFDNAGLQGTKGSGTFLQQTASSFAAGLNGNYAFGLQGDTPCLPSCAVGVIAGPAAAVGQFTADGAGAISGGTQDANVATTNFANSALNGSYGSADGNGRMQLMLNASSMPPGVYPGDYAVYMVNANTAFVMSTDKHSQYILLAGSASLQTPGNFSNASLNGAYVGYENAQSNPGLLGVVLQNVLNLSTATIFRGTASGGSCDTTNVDVGGTTGLVNGLTGLGSGSSILNALLGTYQSTGTSTCAVAASGRTVLNYPVPGSILTTLLQLLGLPITPPAPRVAYLYGQNQGYFLETGYAGLGNLEAQSGSPFTLGTLNGTYVYQTSPASSVVSTNTAGIFQADGLGNINTVYDLNVGVGTINLLQLGITGTFSDTLTDATAGRYLLGANPVVYAISANRFVLLDTSATTTSPSVAVLY